MKPSQTNRKEIPSGRPPRDRPGSLPKDARPGTPLRTRLFLLVLLSSLLPATLVLLAGWLQQRQQVELWTIPSVESALDASLETNRRAFDRLLRHLEAEGRVLAESGVLAEFPDDTTGITSLLHAGCVEFGIDLAQLYVRDFGRFRLIASQTAEGHGGPDASDRIALPGGPQPGPEPRPTLRLDSAEGDLLAVPTYLFGEIREEGAAPIRGALLLAVRLGPQYYQRLQEVSSGLSFYRRLQEVGRVLRTGYGLLAAAVLFVSIVASFLIARRVSRSVSEPIDGLIRQMEEVGRGAATTAAVADSPIPELAQLATAFRSMRETLREYEARLRETERIRGAQETARFVAHEIRNTLTPVRASLSVLQRQVASLDPEGRGRGERALDLIRREADRMSALAGAFSEYARFPERRPVRLDLADLAEGLAREEIPDRIRHQIRRDPDLPLVEVDRDEMERILRNLLKNAVEAISGKGEVTVHLETGSGGKTVRMSVADNGCGMDSETLRKAVQPGYTTKETGTGLGLPLVRRSIAHYGGTMEIESEPGAGTRIRIVMPAAGAGGGSPDADEARRQEGPGPREWTHGNGAEHGQAHPDR